MSDIGLQDTPRTRGQTCNGYHARKDGEKWCWRCGARVSISPSNESVEYGHAQKCPRRPEEFTHRVRHNGVVWSRERVREELQE